MRVGRALTIVVAFAIATSVGPTMAKAALLPGPTIVSVGLSFPGSHTCKAPGGKAICPASGATVIVTVHVVHAKTCSFLAQHLPFSSPYPVKTVACVSGHASVTIPPIANPYKSKVTVTYVVRVRGAGPRFVQGKVTLTEEPAPSTPTPSPTPTPAPTPPSTVLQSPSWSGYVVPSSTVVTEVGGQWTVPTLNCAATPNAGASLWVGIGGFSWPTGGSSGALLQTGVSTDCVSGVQQQHGWWEVVPSNPNHEVDFTGFTVSQGDAIKASVYQDTNGAWDTRVDDLTTGLSGVMVTGQGWGVLADSGNGSFATQGSAARISYSGGYTAEWIVEDYTGPDGATLVPFANYSTVAFTNLTTSLSPWHLTANESIAMVQSGVTLSTPSAPTAAGFTVSYSR